MPPTSKPFLALPLLLALLLSCNRAPAKPTTASPDIIVSPKTTRLAAPLLPDGRVDYFSALDTLASAGVTDDNNAALPLLALFPLTPEDRAQLTSRLHIPQLPDNEKFILFDNPQRASESDLAKMADQECNETRDDPYYYHLWTHDRSALAALIASNAKAFDHLAEASHKPRFFVPLLHRSPNPFFNYAIGQTPPRSSLYCAVKLLVYRALLREERDDFDGFVADLATVQRLALLQSSYPSDADFYIGYKVSDNVARILADMLRRGQLKGQKLLRVAPLLAHAPPRFDPRIVDWDGRFDTLWSMEYGPGGKFLDIWKFEINHPPDLDPTIFKDFKMLRWDSAKLGANSMIDQFVAILCEPTYERSIKARATFEAQCETAGIPCNNFDDLISGIDVRDFMQLDLRKVHPARKQEAIDYLKRRAGESLDAYSQRIGEWIARSNDGIYRSLDHAHTVEMHYATLRVAVALARYREDHAQFPNQLTDLLPAYLPAIPEDYFSAKPLLYAKVGQDVIVYSIGIDGKDDQGGKLRDPPIPTADDIGVRVKASP